MGILKKLFKEKDEEKREEKKPETPAEVKAEPAAEEPDGVPETWEKERSFMLGIPLDERDIMDPAAVVARLEAADGISLRTHFLDDGKIHIMADLLGDTYTMEVWAADFTVPDFYRMQHMFPDVVFESLQTAEAALVTSMEFGDDPLASYHAQLKLLDAMLPDKLAVLDDSSEKILSPMWVSLAASSDIHPSPTYIYTVQAVGSPEEGVWLHTHGLARCGIPELEILDSRSETFNNHYHVIANAASRLLEMETPAPKEPLYLGRLAEDVDLVITMVPWAEAVSKYPEDLLGGRRDREDGHNRNNSCIFVYPDEESYMKKDYKPVFVYDEILADNPLYWLSNNETDRMKALAAERLDYMKRAWTEGKGGSEESSVTVLIKVGLVVDEEYRNDTNDKEHIWFELKELKEDGFTAQLTQEPYYIEGLHAGDMGEYSFSQITDWIIFVPEKRISPDDVYLIESFPTNYNESLN